MATQDSWPPNPGNVGEVGGIKKHNLGASHCISGPVVNQSKGLTPQDWKHLKIDWTMQSKGLTHQDQKPHSNPENIKPKARPEATQQPR